MADLADEAQLVEEAWRTSLLARAAGGLPRGAGQAVCGQCGEPIDPARRRALPAACTCIDCAERLERMRRRK